jgi:hypothetical protein
MKFAVLGMTVCCLASGQTPDPSQVVEVAQATRPSYFIAVQASKPLRMPAVAASPG